MHVYATLRRYTKSVIGQSIYLEMPKNITGVDLLVYLGIPREEVQLFIVDGIVSELNITLTDGCRIGVLPPIAGG